MRTTLDLDDDVLDAIKELSRRQKISAGKMVSQWMRKALSGQAQLGGLSADVNTSAPTVAGFRPFASRGQLVSDDQVNALRDAEGL